MQQWHLWRVDSVKCKQSTKNAKCFKRHPEWCNSATVINYSVFNIGVIAAVIFQLVSLRLTLVVIVRKVYRRKKIPVTMAG